MAFRKKCTSGLREAEPTCLVRGVGEVTPASAPASLGAEWPPAGLGLGEPVLPQQPKLLIPLSMLLVVGLLLASSSGCSLLKGAAVALKDHEGCDEFMIGYRNRAMAAKAWHREKHAYRHWGNLRDLKAGFFAGYMDVAEGGSGCTPALCPSSYSGWRYQSAGGHAACNAWFQGFPLGVAAAEQDGVGHWSHVQFAGHTPMSQQPVEEPEVAPDPADVENIVPGSIEYDSLPPDDSDIFPQDPEADGTVPPLPSLYDEAGAFQLNGPVAGSGVARPGGVATGGLLGSQPSPGVMSPASHAPPRGDAAASAAEDPSGISFRFE